MTDPIRDRLAAALGTGLTLEHELDGSGPWRAFSARDHARDRRVVVKLLPVDAAGAVSVERFRRELSVAAGITHRHVVPPLASGDAQGMPYYTMAFVEGETLRARLGRGRVSLDEAVEILRDVAKGLAAAHARGVVHRDVTPEHVLLVPGAALVTDVGVAKAIAASAGAERTRGGITAPGLAVGTPAYMAPELVAGDPLMDHRVDLYAWGVIAYELLAGEHPFAGRASGDARAVTPIAAREPSLPRPLAQLEERALQKTPSARPSSASELVSMLGHLRLEGSSPARPRRVSDGPASRLVRRTPPALPAMPATPAVPVGPAASAGPAAAVSAARVPWRGALATLAVVGALAAGFVFLRRDAGPGPTDTLAVAVAPFRVSGAPDVPYLREGMMDLLAPALSGVAGTRAVDVRSFLAALRREATPADPDLDALLRPAQRLGAAQLIDGSVTGTRERMTIRATLFQVRDGAELTQATVEGPADSVPALAARLAASLVASRAGDLENRLSLLLGRDPEAVRHYLDGLGAYRRGGYDRALASFDAAVDRDSTFAMAALRGELASGWALTPAPRPRLAMAWGRRDRLTADDSMLVDVIAGRMYPAPTPVAERIASAERLVARLPDQAEAHVLLGELLFRAGQLADVPDWMSRAIEQFERAVALDGTLRPARERLPSLYALSGRRDEARTALAALKGDDSAGGLPGPLLRLETAAVVGDTDEVRRATASALRMAPTLRATVGAVFAAEALGHVAQVERLVWSAWDESLPTARRELVGPALTAALALGQAWRLWDVLRAVPDDTLRAAASLVAATMAGVEPMPVAEATRLLEAALPVALAAPAAPMGRHAFTVADGPWALVMAAGARGDTIALRGLRRTLEGLNGAAFAEGPAPMRRAGLLALVDLELARAAGALTPAVIAAADSAAPRLPDVDGLGVRWLALRVARAWGDVARLPDARRVIARNVPAGGGPLVAASWREVARLAEAAGARDDARRAWAMVRRLQERASRGERAMYDEATAALGRLAPDAPARAPLPAPTGGT
ncbi:MAG: protein kinase domain-containing protein [Gemmatimonadota bacterium]